MRKLSMLALVLTAVCAGPAAAADLKDAMLSVHNAERAAVGVNPLTWSDALASDAAQWAQRLAQIETLQHSTPDQRPGQGENLWMGSAGGYTPAQMAQAWADEKSAFRVGTFPDVTTGGVVGHYTQMVWRGTTTVGCAIASSAKFDVLVCRYAPAGNMVGESVY